MLSRADALTSLAKLAPLVIDSSANLAIDTEFPEPLLGVFDYHGVSALLADHTGVPSHITPDLKHRRALNAANDALQMAELAQVLTALKRQGLDEVVLFKGAALAHTVYASPWMRPRSDVDLLVDVKQKTVFSHALQELGFESQFGISGDYVSYQHSFAKKLSAHNHLHIDLHWRISNRQCLAQSFKLCELIERSRKFDFEHSSQSSGAAALAPSNVDSLLIAALHRLGHHHREERLTWLLDIHLLAESLSEAQWQTFVTLAAEKRLATLSLDALSTSRSFLLTKLPDAVIDELIELAKEKEPSQILVHRDLPEYRYFINDLNALSDLQSKCRFVMETVFPNPAYIRHQMQTRFAAWGYIKRFIRGISRVSRSKPDSSN